MKISKIMTLGTFLGSFAVSILSLSTHSQASEDKSMTVFKSPWCGCCQVWVEAMENAGYRVTVNDLDDLSSIKKQASVTNKLEGCHTAVLGEYVLEGHVPLEAISKLMVERPKIRGIAVPGMPQGSLGMGYDKNAKYEVLAFEHDTSKPAYVYFKSGV
jgi:hypothetical protein